MPGCSSLACQGQSVYPVEKSSRLCRYSAYYLLRPPDSSHDLVGSVVETEHHSFSAVGEAVAVDLWVLGAVLAASLLVEVVSHCSLIPIWPLDLDYCPCEASPSARVIDYDLMALVNHSCLHLVYELPAPAVVVVEPLLVAPWSPEDI